MSIKIEQLESLFGSKIGILSTECFSRYFQIWEAGRLSIGNDIGSLSGRLLQLTQLQRSPPETDNELPTIKEAEHSVG